jgi:carbon-monoxide dehydrogenase medium subunit
VAAGIAYRSVRNLGTIGGSLAHADPAADWPVVLAALEGTIRILGSREQRRSIPVAGFIQGPFTTSLESGELIEAVEISKPPVSARFGYYKFCRKAGDFPEASAAVVLDPNHLRSRIYIGALSGPPLPLHELASDVSKRGRGAVSESNIIAAVRSAAPGLDPVDTVMHAGVVLRAVQYVLTP